MKEQGRRYAIVDAITDAHLLAIGEAAASHALITGGSGVAMGLAENFRRAGLLPVRDDPAALPRLEGACAVVAGSCSRATLAQLGYARNHMPVFDLDPLETPDAAALARAALDWASGKIGDKPVVDRRLRAAGESRGAAVAPGPRRRPVPWSRTPWPASPPGWWSAACAGWWSPAEKHPARWSGRLGVRSLRIGAEIDPGVPWTMPPAAAPT